MHPALSQLAHRPWALPAGAWTMRQSWCDLLFAHWRVEASALRKLIPSSLEVQQFDGSAWLGVVPFRMTGVMYRPWPDLPGLSAFPELNLRTYVERDGKPGVWFFSLDATNPLAVWAARRFYHLPYFGSDITLSESPSGFHYAATRRNATPAVHFRGSYRPTSDCYLSQPGTLEHFLTERYCLYAQSPRGQLFRTDIHHAPWPLQSAEAEIAVCDLHAPHGLSLTGPPETLHFAKQIDVVVWSPERLGS